MKKKLIAYLSSGIKAIACHSSMIVRNARAMATAMVMIFVGSAQAATYYWDDNSSSADFGTAGASTGTWAAPTAGPTAGWSLSTTGANIFAPFTTGTADLLNFGNGATGLDSGTITVGTVSAGNMTFASGSGAIALSGGTITLAPAETITVDNTSDTIGSILAGAAASLTKLGTGTLTLSGVNTYAGTNIINAGTLTLSGARTVTAGAINVAAADGSSATLNVSLGTFTVGTFMVGNSPVTPAMGIVNQSGGSLTMSANQLLVGNGIATGTYNLSGGTLTTTGNSALGVVLGVNTGTTGNFNLSGTGTLNMSATTTLQICRSDNSAASGTTGLFNQTAGTATVGILQMGGSSTTPANNANANATLTLTGGSFTVTTFNQLSGANNSTSTINIGGTAVVTLPAFPTARGTSSTADIIFDGGTLKPAAASAAYMSNLTSAKIKAGGAKFDTSFDITIPQDLLTDAVSTGGGLTKIGANTLILTGTNTYSGTTAVNAGTLLVNSPGSLAASSDVTVAAGTTLGGNGTINGTVMASATALLSPGASVGAIGTLTLTDSSASALTLNSNVVIFDLPSSVTASDRIDSTGGLVLNGNSTVILKTPTAGTPAGTYTLMTYSGAPSGLGSLTFANGTTTQGNATLNVGSGSVTLTVASGGLVGTTTYTGAGSSGGTDGWNVAARWNTGVVPAGTTNIVLAPTGTQSVTAFNTSIPTYSGDLTINPGVQLQIGWTTVNAASYNALGTPGTTFIYMGSGSSILTRNAGSPTFSDLVLLGNVSVRLGDSTQSGALATFRSIKGPYSFSLNTHGIGGAAGSANYTMANSFTALNITGTGTHTASAANSIGTASVTMGDGTNPTPLTLNHASALTDSANPIRINYGTLTFGTPAAAPLSLPTRPIELNGAGGATINNANTASSSANILSVGGGISSTASGAKTLTLGGANTGNNTISGNIVNGSAGSIALTKADAGKWVLSGTNTYSGDTTVSAGTLVIGAVGAIPSTTKLYLPSASGKNITMNADNTVAILYLGGVQQPNGVYTSAGAGSAWMNAGSGKLTVGAPTAQNVYWDLNGSSGGAGSATPSGTWDATTGNWNGAPDGTDSTGAWTVGGTAAFAAGTDATGAYTVNVQGSPEIGGLTFEEGTVTVTGGTELRMVNHAVINASAGLTATIETPITQDATSRTLTKFGAGTIILSGANTYTGSTTVNNGRLKAGVATVSGTSGAFGNNTAVTMVDDATAVLDLNGYNNTIASLSGGGTTGGNVALGVNGTLTTGGGTIFAGIISGTGTSGLIKTGANTLILTGINTYQGDTTIGVGGTLQLGNNNTTGSLGGGSYGGNIIINGTLDIQSSSSITLSGILSGSGPLVKRNSGNLTLSGANTFRGKVTHSSLGNASGAGTLTVSSFNSVNGGTPLLASSSLGAPTTIANGTIQLGSGHSSPNPVLKYVGTGETTDRVIEITFNSGAIRTLDASGSGLLKFTSAFLANGQSSGGITVTGTGSGEIAGAIPNIGSGALTKSGNGTWTFSGANVYTCPTKIDGGQLRVATGIGTRCTSAVTIANTAGCIFGVQLASTGGQWVSSSTLTVEGPTAGRNEIDIDYNGTVPSTLVAPIQVTTLTVSATGTLKVISPDLAVGNTYPLINFTTGPAVADPYIGLTLSLPAGITGTLKTTATQLQLVITANTHKSWNSGSANWDTDTPWSVGGIASAFATSDTVYLDDASGVTGNPTLTISGASVSPTAVIMNSASHDYTIAGGAIATGTLTVNAPARTLTLSGANTYSGATTISAGQLRITDGSALGSTDGGTTQSGTSALEVDGTSGVVIVGAEALTINGGGIVNGGALRNIAGNNTYGGTVTLAAQSRINSDSGTLTLNNATAVTGAFNLVIGGAGNITISGAITTTTKFVSKDGAGTLTLSGANTYSGGTTIGTGGANVGIVNITHSSALGTGLVSIVGNTTTAFPATLMLNSVTGIAVANNFTTSGEGQEGNGIIRNVTGTNTISGSISLFSGGGNTRIQSDGGSLTLSGTITNGYTSARTLVLSGSATGTVSGVIANGLGGQPLLVTKQGAGTWIFSNANNTYTGATTVVQGTLKLGVNNALPSTSAISLGNGTLDTQNNQDTTVGTLDVTGSATINLGTDGKLEFAASNDIDWAGGSLTITGNFVSGSSIRFGINGSGLTAPQLAKISMLGVSTFFLDGSGYLVAIRPTLIFLY